VERIASSVPSTDHRSFWFRNTATELLLREKNPPQETTKAKSDRRSCRLQRVELEDVVIGRRGEEELLLAGGAVVAGAVQPQRPLEVQELTHEVEVRGNVGLLPLDEVVGVVEREVEPLHQVGHGDRDGAADAGQAVDQDAALLGPSFIWRTEGNLSQSRVGGQKYIFSATLIPLFDDFNAAEVA